MSKTKIPTFLLKSLLQRLSIFLFFLCPIWTFAGLPVGILEQLKRAGVGGQSLYLAIEPITQTGASGLAFKYQADVPVQLASVVKLVTTASALQNLGPNFTVTTDFLGRLSENSQQLATPLIIRGAGDPDFQIEDLWLALQQLRQSGVKEIPAGLLLDVSSFSRLHQVFPVYQRDGAGFVDRGMHRAYHAQPHALLMNYAAASLLIEPVSHGVNVRFETAPNSLRLNARIRAVSGPCVSWKDNLVVHWSGMNVDVSGDFPLACGGSRLPLRVPDPAAWLAAWVFDIWQGLGGSITNTWALGSTPADALVLQHWKSRPLNAWVRNINKYSNNVMAQHLMFLNANAAMNMHLQRRPLDIASVWFNSMGFEPKGLILESGSGLSRIDRIAVGDLAQALQQWYKHPAFFDFMGSLPRAGQDGTLSKRFTDLPVQAYLKTGRLSGVSALGGYLRDSRGRMWVWVSALNGYELEDRWDIHAMLLQWFALQLT